MPLLQITRFQENFLAAAVTASILVTKTGSTRSWEEAGTRCRTRAVSRKPRDVDREEEDDMRQIVYIFALQKRDSSITPAILYVLQDKFRCIRNS
jgi:hypothetical protein